jgi:hypothetical protein
MKLDDFINIVKPFTMTSVERITGLYYSLEHIRINKIEGDFVECGVWKGGNVLGILEYLTKHNMTKNNVWLYDTFEGMTDPEDIDVDSSGKKGDIKLEEVLCYSSLKEVKNILSVSSYPKDKIKFIEGDVCETLKTNVNVPKNISLLRLDTDWYKSTKKELEVLYPLLSSKGVLIVDDYGHWKGSKMAVDEYFNNLNLDVEIHKLDYTGIKIIKD